LYSIAGIASAKNLEIPGVTAGRPPHSAQRNGLWLWNSSWRSPEGVKWKMGLTHFCTRKWDLRHHRGWDFATGKLLLGIRCFKLELGNGIWKKVGIYIPHHFHATKTIL